MKETNMQEVQAYLKECGAFFIATADGDQPHVRPFGVSVCLEEIRQRVDAPKRNPGQRRDTGRQGGIPEPQRELEVNV